MYKVIIGLEIHTELNTKSKMFCSCLNNPDEKEANINVCPICLGHPGTLPVINEQAVKKVIKTGMALNCRIPENSKFDRKNYFYPDLPKGYQISQYDMPIARQGELKIKNQKSKIKIVRIARIHLEEDTGKLSHPKGADYSLVDFNRAGVPLMELVTEPDITSAKEARKFVEELQLYFRYLNISNADMEKGQFRVEVNISLTKDVKQLGTKVEIKNLNSFRAVEKGIDYEIKRQTKVLNEGKKIIQETRGWNDAKEVTFSQREKEESHDYRYFPEPDLPMLSHSEEFITEIRSGITELPQQRRERFKEEYGLLEKEIEVFVVYKELGEYFEKTMSELRNWVKEIEIKSRVEKDEFLRLTKLCSNYIISDLQGLMKESKVFVESNDFKITPENFAEFVCLIYKKEISSKIAKIVLEEMFKTGAGPSHIIKERGLSQITDIKEIERIAREVISKNPKAIEDYKKGKQNAFQFLIGQIMAQSRGKANPQVVRDVLNQLLSGVDKNK